MHAIAIHARNPFQPLRDRAIYSVEAPLTIAEWIEREAPDLSAPTICLLNGEPVLRAEWGSRAVTDGDVLAFVALPQGGGDSNPLAIVMMIVVSIVAPPIGAALASEMGLAAGSLGAALVKGAVAFAMTALVNAVIPAPKPTGPQSIRDIAAPSPTYSLQAQGNAARLGSPIPAIYGRHLIYPDFGAQPYAEFAGNEQYLYMLFVIGQGYYDIESIRIEDTTLDVFEDVATEIVEPGENVTLFPTNVVSSSEVVGQEVDSGVTVGPFVASAAGTASNYIAIDVVMPRGLYYAQDDGSLASKSVTWVVEAQPINASGAPIGGWTTLGTETYSAATNTAQRASYRYAVSAGRYQVKLTRSDTKDTSTRAGHELAWVGLRAYLPGGQAYGDITLLAVRMRASNQLSGVSSRKINLTVTRKLPTWSGGGWTAPTVTRSIAWALADICRAQYGAELADSRIAIDELAALNTTWAARGDTFNAVYDSRMGFWEALTVCARAGRAVPILQGGIIHFVRDAVQTLPVALFSMRNIVRGSFRIEYALQNDQTTDAAEADYFDETTWSPKTVLAVLPGGTSDRPAKLRGTFGMTTRAQVWREAVYTAAQNRWRRKIVNFQTELEGFIPTFGDLIAISHDMPAWGSSGEIVSIDEDTPSAGDVTLHLSEPVTFGVGTHYIALRRRDGSVEGPFVCTAGPSTSEAVVAGGLDGFVPQTGRSEERTHFAFGLGESYRQRAIVTAVRARGNVVEISAVNEDDRVHTADEGSVPGESIWVLPGIPTVPQIPYDGANPDSFLSVVMGGTLENPTVTLSWSAAAGAERYYVEQSFDGDVWTRIGDTVDTRFGFTASPGFQYLRVAPAGAGIGAWRVWSGTVTGGPQVVAPDAPTGLVATAAGLSIILEWPPHGQPNIEWIEIQRSDGFVSDGIIAVIGAENTSYVDTLAASGLSRLYWYRLVNKKGVRSDWSAYASATTAAVGGIEVVTSLPSTGLTEGRVVYLTTNKSIYRYNGTSWTAAVDGADILANTIGANKLSVATLAAITANLGAITAGSLNINSRFVVDAAGNVTINNAATGARLEIKNNVIKVFDAGGVLRVKLGDLSA